MSKYNEYCVTIGKQYTYHINRNRNIFLYNIINKYFINIFLYVNIVFEKIL